MTSAEFTKTLRRNCEALADQYATNVEDVHALQNVFLDDILPSVGEELCLDDEGLHWAQSWLEDTTTIFHILRRNNYTKSAAMEYIRKTLSWRCKHLWNPSNSFELVSRVCVLPDPARDPFGRPILCVDASILNELSNDSLPSLTRTVEALRLHLQSLRQDGTGPLQYTVLFDLKGLSMQSISVDMIYTFIGEVIPRFPGMVAAVFMLNYSWTQSGLWGIAKRVLPASALSRVIFPSQQELLDIFASESLPEDFGGNFQSLASLSNPLHSFRIPTYIEPPQPPKSEPSRPRLVSLSSTSYHNPFYGYPVNQTQTHRRTSKPILPHGRRRKRDLAKTLLMLFWFRWKGWIVTSAWVLALGLTGWKLGPKRRGSLSPRFRRLWSSTVNAITRD